MSERMLFVGASTAGSRSFELFPPWSAILGIDATLEGRDIPLGAPPKAFRATIEQIAEDPTVAGALVTTHKVDVYRHARALFAIAVCLAGGERPPARLVVTDTDAGRLVTPRTVLDEVRPKCEVVLAAAEENDAGLEQLPPGSLVVNATGLGKDAPGSPLSARPSSPSEGSSGSSTTAASCASSSRRGDSRMLVAWSSTTGGGTSSTAGSR